MALISCRRALFAVCAVPSLLLFLLSITPAFAQENNPAVFITETGDLRAPGGGVVKLPKHRTKENGDQPVIYPKEAVENGVEGTVRLQLRIDSDGDIKESKTLDNGGDARLLRAAVEGLRRAGFTAGSIDGKAAEMSVNVEVAFSLGEKIYDFAPVALPDMEDGPVADVVSPVNSEEEHGMDDYVADAVLPQYDPMELQALLEYPSLARENGLEGRVVVSVQVSTTGKVLQVVIRSSSNEIFEGNAKAAVRQLKYTPGKVDGMPIKAWTTMTVDFILVDDEPDSSHMSDEEVSSDRAHMDDYYPNAQPPTYDPGELARLLQYPELARRNNLEGRMVVSVLVGPTGKVLDAVVLESTNLLFETEAVRTVRQLQYTPGTEGGRPTKMWTNITIDFVLGD